MPENKPNVVFVLVDNVGWGDWGIYGGTTCKDCFSVHRIKAERRLIAAVMGE